MEKHLSGHAINLKQTTRIKKLYIPAQAHVCTRTHAHTHIINTQTNIHTKNTHAHAHARAHTHINTHLTRKQPARYFLRALSHSSRDIDP